MLAAAHAERFGTGFDEGEVLTYRRKFLWNSSRFDLATNPRRPPFYGSVSRIRCLFFSFAGPVSFRQFFQVKK